LRIVRLSLVRDEADILARNVDWYADKGFVTVLVDNGSADGSFEIARKALRDGRIAALDRMETAAFEWDVLWSRALELARAQHPDWLLVTGTDEFFETADGADLHAALAADADAGYNLVKFHNMEFWMTERDDREDPDPLRRLRHYSCYDVEMYRAYPAMDGLDILKHSVHRPAFPPGTLDRPSPRRYVSRHYKLRSLEQAQRKIARVRPTARLPESNVHYLKYTRDPTQFVVPSSTLHQYRDDHVWRYDSVYDGGRLSEAELQARLRARRAELANDAADG
jgi:hypothetical protein